MPKSYIKNCRKLLHLFVCWCIDYKKSQRSEAYGSNTRTDRTTRTTWSPWTNRTTRTSWCHRPYRPHRSHRSCRSTGPTGATGTTGPPGQLELQEQQEPQAGRSHRSHRSNRTHWCDRAYRPYRSDRSDGPSGPPGPGAIIPFASGPTVSLTTLLGGLVGTQGLIGFGSNELATAVGGIIDTTSLDNVAFIMPRDGIITAISAFFSVNAAVNLLGSEVTIFAQLWSAMDSNQFTPVPGTEVALSPALTGLVNIGTTVSGNLPGLNILVAEGTRLMLVFSARVTGGLDLATTIIGFASGGVAID